MRIEPGTSSSIVHPRHNIRTKPITVLFYPLPLTQSMRLNRHGLHPHGLGYASARRN